MAYISNILPIVLDGTGTEIPTLSVNDTYEKYIITGTQIAIGNYAIVPAGSPLINTTFLFEYDATLDITTNGTTFSIFGQSLNQTQLNSKLVIECRYNGSGWIVKVLPSITSVFITGANIATATIDASTKLQANSVTNSRLSQMSAYTVKANNTGSTATPQDVAMSTLTNGLAWGLTGNSGTTAGTNFIGTTDNVDVVFKRNSTQSGRISSTNTSLGVNAFSSNTFGTDCVAIGAGALGDNTTGIQNTAVGSGALISSVGFTSSTNTAVGHASMQQVTTGGGNSAIGVLSLGALVNGQNNISIGNSTGITLVSGNRNTLIGHTADVDSSSANNRIALGQNAVATADHQFAIPDNVTTIKFKGIVYTLPTVNAAGVLTNDGSGVLTWS